VVETTEVLCIDFPFYWVRHLLFLVPLSLIRGIRGAHSP
jgi:hypothetical protein